MAQLLVIYNTPPDTAAFDSHYSQTHIPLAHKIPGLRASVLRKGPVQALAGIAPHLVAILHFDSLADLNAALASPEGQAAAARFVELPIRGRDLADLRQQGGVNARASIARLRRALHRRLVQPECGERGRLLFSRWLAVRQ